MAALVRSLSHVFVATSPEVQAFKVVAAFCGVGLLVSVLLMTYGVDLSQGFF